MTESPLANPEFLPYRLDLVGRRVLWVRMSDAQRRQAAFLDERALPTNPEGGWLSIQAWLQTRGVPPALPADAIFHIGHCGSTLLARLLEGWPEVHSLREPLPLRVLADAWPTRGEPDARLSSDDAEHLLRAAWSAWSRPLPPHTRSVVKATSSCNVLAEPLLQAHPGMRAILLDMPLRPWLATLFKSPDSVLDAAAAAPERLRLLRSHGLAEDQSVHGMSLPEQCAMGWLAESLRFDAVQNSGFGRRVMRVDFETLLERPEVVLTDIAAHLSLDRAHLPQVLALPAWSRYSKAQSHGYGRKDRAHDLALAMQRHAAEVEAGERWLQAFLERHPALSRLIRSG